MAGGGRPISCLQIASVRNLPGMMDATVISAHECCREILALRGNMYGELYTM